MINAKFRHHDICISSSTAQRLHHLHSLLEFHYLVVIFCVFVGWLDFYFSSTAALICIVFVDLKEAYIADSESSSIRALDLKTGGSRLLAGGDPVFSDNLFKVI